MMMKMDMDRTMKLSKHVDVDGDNDIEDDVNRDVNEDDDDNDEDDAEYDEDEIDDDGIWPISGISIIITCSIRIIKMFISLIDSY